MSDFGLITGLWRCCRPKVPYWGAYPSGFLLKARRVMGVPLNQPILHVCGGRARDYSKPEFGITKGTPQRGFGPRDKTLDLDPELQPDFLQDAREPLPGIHAQRDGVALGRGRIGYSQPRCGQNFMHGGPCRCGWPGILIDRPYTEQDATHYQPGADKLPNLNALLKNAAQVLAPGGRVGVLDYLVPSPPKDLELVALFGVMVGFNNRMRSFAVFEKVEP